MATYVLYPDTDVTANWDTTTGANHYGEIDEGTTASGGTPSDVDYIETTTINDDDRFSFTPSPANVSEVTQVDVNIRGYIDDASSTAKFSVDVEHSAGTPLSGSPYNVTGTDLGGYGTTPAEDTESFTSLTLTKTQIDSLEVEVTFLAS
jgi:hypothetical protein